ncbi:MAG: hypothetical protein ACFFD2_05890 [Promethearchaeota archaeon]
MIRAGIMLENDLFVEDNLKSVKIFYGQVRTIPEVLATFVTLGFNDRARRSAAQPAYFVKQIATRLLTALQYQQVHVLRLEDLSWAKHARKQEVGYFLAI